MWLDALFLGALLALFVRWQVNVASTDKLWTKILVYWLVLLHLGSSGYTLAVQIELFVKGFGEYRNFLNVNCTYPSSQGIYCALDSAEEAEAVRGGVEQEHYHCVRADTQGPDLPLSSTPSPVFPPAHSSCTAPG